MCTVTSNSERQRIVNIFVSRCRTGSRIEETVSVLKMILGIRWDYADVEMNRRMCHVSTWMLHLYNLLCVHRVEGCKLRFFDTCKGCISRHDGFYDLTEKTFARLTDTIACDQFLSRATTFILVASSDRLHIFKYRRGTNRRSPRNVDFWEKQRGRRTEVPSLQSWLSWVL